jgi:hypothetical protein
MDKLNQVNSSKGNVKSKLKDPLDIIDMEEKDINKDLNNEEL